jgi:hypothetical protein
MLQAILPYVQQQIQACLAQQMDVWTQWQLQHQHPQQQHISPLTPQQMSQAEHSGGTNSVSMPLVQPALASDCSAKTMTAVSPPRANSIATTSAATPHSAIVRMSDTATINSSTCNTNGDASQRNGSHTVSLSQFASAAPAINGVAGTHG